MCQTACWALHQFYLVISRVHAKGRLNLPLAKTGARTGTEGLRCFSDIGCVERISEVALWNKCVRSDEVLGGVASGPGGD